MREDLIKEIENFIKYSELEAIDYTKEGNDTNIYWVQFFEKDGENIVVIMQQPFYYSSDCDGYIKINENLVFFYFSDSSFITTDNLNKNIPENIPDQFSRESELGYSAPNWAYLITEKGLKKTFIGE